LLLLLLLLLLLQHGCNSIEIHTDNGHGFSLPAPGTASRDFRARRQRTHVTDVHRREFRRTPSSVTDSVNCLPAGGELPTGYYCYRSFHGVLEKGWGAFGCTPLCFIAVDFIGYNSHVGRHQRLPFIFRSLRSPSYVQKVCRGTIQVK
jgi:hypothetical protein